MTHDWWNNPPPTYHGVTIQWDGVENDMTRLLEQKRAESVIVVSELLYRDLFRLDRGWVHWWNWPGFALVMLACSLPAFLCWVEGGKFDPRSLRDGLHWNAVRGELSEDDDEPDDWEEW